MRVLIAESDAALSGYLKKGMKTEGHEVECVQDGQAAVQHLRASKPDLLVLDLGRPEPDGTDVLEVVRESSPETVVVVLTGQSDVEERVRCLNAGADDVLLKPFSFCELAARCRAVLRRKVKFASPLLEHGGVTMNLLERRVRHGCVDVDLTVKEFAVLEVLLRRRGECVARLDVLEAVWPGAPATGVNVVDVYVTYLRRKFAEAQRKQGHLVELKPVIETVRGAGYRLSEARKPVESVRKLSVRETRSELAFGA